MPVTWIQVHSHRSAGIVGQLQEAFLQSGTFFAYIFTILLVLLPLMFIHPTIIAERKNVKSATNAVYDIELKTLLPIRDASADLDGRPIALTKTGSHSYSAEITQNGTLTITAASVNGQTVTRTYQVSHLDTDKPELVNSYSQDGVVYLEILDTFSGIDYDHITGITPESVNTDTGVIAFRIPDNPTTVTIPGQCRQRAYFALISDQLNSFTTTKGRILT